MSKRRRRTITIFSPHNVDQIKRFCKQGLRVESLLEKEIARIAKEPIEEGDEGKRGAQFELIKRHREHISKISEVRLHFQTMFQHTGTDIHNGLRPGA